MKRNPFEPYDPPKLTIELVPRGQWFDNVRKAVKPSQWNGIKTACFVKAGYRCEICHGKGKKHPVECHERWHYDDDKKVQTLLGVISLCPSCHRVKHIGNAARMGYLIPALKHMAKVNNWPIHMAEAYADVCMNQWQWRSEFEWTVDMSWLNEVPEYITAAQAHEKAAQRAASVTLSDAMTRAMTSRRTAQT